MLGGGKRRCYLDAGFVADRISTLPCIVKDHILSFLPLREAAKTSVLSTEWRHDWTYRPILYFDDNHRKPLESLKLLEPYDAYFYQTLLDVLCILKLHRGRLREFALVLPELEEFYDLNDQIMCHLDGTHMESFTIDVKDYILPISCISTFRKLRKLQLSCCQFASSAIAFGDSFPLLTVLELTKVTTLLKGGQVSFSYKCPLLEDLTMDRCCEDDDANKINIVIEAPSLHSFRIVGSFNLLEFKHTPLLKRVSVQQGYKVLVKNQQELFRIFEIMDDGFPTAKPLSVFGYFYQYLKVGSESAAIVKQNKLSHLTWDEMCLNSSKQCPVVGLLNYSYDLEELIIDVSILSYNICLFISSLKSELSIYCCFR
ncbi:F-box/FBD/LRR-repeat protein At1g13570 [Linum grandiflorum]